MTIIAVIIHVITSVSLGYSILSILKEKPMSGLWIIESLITGMLVESLLGFIMLCMGINEFIAFYVTVIFIVAYIVYYYYFKKNINLRRPTFRYTLNTLELIILLAIIGKICLVFYQFIMYPLYFDDALTHWGGRAYALYGKVNWSMAKDSEFLLGSTFGFKEYPLCLVIWRSINGHIAGTWSDIAVKADSFIFYISLLWSVYAIIKHITDIKWVAISSSFMISALPILHLHASAGYAEIAMALIVLITFACLINRTYITAAIITAAGIWIKNEGLFLYFPAFTVCLLIILIFDKKIQNKKIQFIKYIGTTLLLISPWILFKLINQIPYSVSSLSVEKFYHAGSFSLLIEKIFYSPSTNIFWIVVFTFIVFGFPVWKKNFKIIIAILFLLIIFVLLAYVFCFTSAYKFLVNDMTTYRSLMQIAPIGILIVSLSLADSICDSKP